MVQHVLLTVLLTVATLATPFDVHAAPFPPQEIFETAECMEQDMASVLRGPVLYPPTDTGWQIIVPVRGQPNADPGLQFRPPAEDGDYVLDVVAVLKESEIGEIDRFADVVVKGGDGRIWVGRTTGLFWMRAKVAAVRCLEEATGGQEI